MAKKMDKASDFNNIFGKVTVFRKKIHLKLQKKGYD